MPRTKEKRRHVQTPGLADCDARRAADAHEREGRDGRQDAHVGSSAPTAPVAQAFRPADNPGRLCCREDPAEILTRRLAQLGEREYMRTVLQDALEQLMPRAFAVEGYEIDHCKVTPWRDISLALSVMVRSTRTGHRSRQIVSGTIFTTADTARRQLQQERPAATRIDWRTRVNGEDGTLASMNSMALVPEMAAVVRLFPYDAGLTGLARVTDRPAMTALFTASLPACHDKGWRIRDVECEPVQYKPGRLCTLRYRLTLDHPRHLDSKRVDVFGKVYRDDRWRQSYALLKETWQASLASGGTWRAAEPIAAVGSWRFIVQSAVSGRQFRHVLADLTMDGAQPGAIQEAEAHLAAVARAARAMHQSPITLGPCLDFNMLLASQRVNLEHLRQVHADLAGELHRLRATIERLGHAMPPCELRLSHGDFAHGNVMLDDGRVGIIDFDRSGQAEPIYDVAYFLTHLTSFSLRHPERAAHLRRLGEHFRDSYGELAPSVSPRRLAVYEALDLSAYVLRNFRKRSHQAEWMGWAKGQIASAWERLDRASAGERTAS
jgi:Ser/Thr protein kinase RdoA (MazF antagonist)